MTTPTTTLPTIVLVLGQSDAGEFGADSCAHCGADCRYQTSFLCSDGSTRKAARGCIQLFPQSPLVRAHRKHLDAVRDKQRKGWNLASWDVARGEAFDALVAGEIDEIECARRVADADREAKNYAARKFGRR